MRFIRQNPNKFFQIYITLIGNLIIAECKYFKQGKLYLKHWITSIHLTEIYIFMNKILYFSYFGMSYIRISIAIYSLIFYIKENPYEYCRVYIDYIFNKKKIFKQINIILVNEKDPYFTKILLIIWGQSLFNFFKFFYIYWAFKCLLIEK